MGFQEPGPRPASDICLTGLSAGALGIPTTMKPWGEKNPFCFPGQRLEEFLFQQ